MNQPAIDTSTSRPRRPWPWALAGFAAGAALTAAVFALARTPADAVAADAPAAVATPDAQERFVPPLDRQADTGTLPISVAQVPFRSDTFRIALASGDEAGHELEQKLRAAAGTTLGYSWSVSGIDNPEEFYVDLHGHAPPAPGYREDSFRQGGGLADSGSFVVPFDGIHGWLFKNDSAGPAVVTLQVSGFYTPVPAEELAAIEAQIEALAAQ